MTNVTAICVTFNSESVIGECLGALKAEGVPVLVVDNASNDRTVALAMAGGAQVIQNPRNEGFGRANNIGARAAENEFLLFINPDAQIEKGAVQALLLAAKSYPQAGLFGPQIIEPDGRIFYHAKGLLGDFLSGACFLIRRELLFSLGGFDENIFLFYEDDDLCRRICDAGYTLHYAEEAKVRHLRGASTGKSKGTHYITRWHQAWSRFYILDKYRIRKPIASWLLKFGFKYLYACIAGNPRLKQRYGGSFAGALAYASGKTALEKQGLQA